ncbi:type I restriction endonuclease, partial [Empedobacter sp.]|uniref:type I restriction endonuclease n=1 Tax=Empedobacter sp. TaxID=1927715 RepID=UPI0028A6FA56
MYKTIAESNNYIVLDKYTKFYDLNEAPIAYQSEAALEKEFIQDLIDLGYENPTHLKSTDAMLANVRTQLQALNNMAFTDNEWARFLVEYLDKPSDSLVDKSRKLHDNHIYDFVFDDGHIQNIYLVDKDNITRNKVQVISQVEQTGSHANRYDVTILVNGLPM